MRASPRVVSVAIAASVAGFALLIGLAMRTYPGGTAWDPTASGHHFWLNYVCDLARTTALDGRPNGPGSCLAQAALLVLGGGALLSWWGCPWLFRGASTLAAAVRALGSSSVAGMLAVALLPSDRFAALHPLALALSGGPGLAAAACASVGLARRERLAFGVGVTGLLLGAVDLALYAGQLAGHDPGPVAAVLERVAFLVELAWMCVIAWRLRTVEWPRASFQSSGSGGSSLQATASTRRRPTSTMTESARQPLFRCFDALICISPRALSPETGIDQWPLPLSQPLWLLPVVQPTQLGSGSSPRSCIASGHLRTAASAVSVSPESPTAAHDLGEPRPKARSSPRPTSGAHPAIHRRSSGLPPAAAFASARPRRSASGAGGGGWGAAGRGGTGSAVASTTRPQ